MKSTLGGHFVQLKTPKSPLQNNCFFQEWNTKKSGFQTDLSKLEFELQSTSMAKNRAEDDLADCNQKISGIYKNYF